MTQETASFGEIDGRALADLATGVPAFERAIERAVRSLPGPDSLGDAMRYATERGKRVRPRLAMLSAMASGGSPEDALAAAVALEMVHAFSLVHDDLPALDNDDLRRGRATLHRHTSEAMALLAGDALLNGAFVVLAGCEADAGVRSAMVGELSRATQAMIAGQVLDLAAEREPPVTSDRLSMLHRIHEQKTGALIVAACRMGAIAAGGDARTLSTMEAVGRNLGLMFQIVDDLLDVERSPEEVGKATGKDAERGKLTFPGLLGVEASRGEVARLEAECLELLAGLGEGAGRVAGLGELCRSLAVRSR
ncbi:MAG: polyprenyl synthetase family protein [Phycisphaerales bacterium JB037]